MKKLTSVIIFALFVIMTISCSEQKPFTIDNSGESVTFSNDSEFQVQLVTNASTGNQWVVMPYDSTVIKQLGEPVYTKDDDRIGSSSLATYTFKAVADGSTKLVMEYGRRWETEKPALKVFELNIAVGTMGRLEE